MSCNLRLTKPRNCHRIVVLGAPRVGKTNILRRFMGKDFEESYEPTIEDFHRKLFHIGGEAYQVDLLDAASERDFPAKRMLFFYILKMNANYLNLHLMFFVSPGDIFLLVFSLDDRESLSEACELLSEIKAAKAKLLKLKQPVRVPVIVCGNKGDLDSERVVRRPDVGKILGEDISFFETSAKTVCKALWESWSLPRLFKSSSFLTLPFQNQIINAIFRVTSPHNTYKWVNIFELCYFSNIIESGDRQMERLSSENTFKLCSN
uniref:RASD family member 2 n=1 Tax=Pundamilia nyererei TaxID=303518 RepID=A0A3B4FRX9_9CICH